MENSATRAYARMMGQNSWGAKAFLSVYARGFHDDDAIPMQCKDLRLSTQFVRLVEEVLEWAGSTSNRMEEAADVCIVAANMAALIDHDVSRDLANANSYTVAEALEGVARAMRGLGDPLVAENALRIALSHVVASMGTWATYNAPAGREALRLAILLKLQGDEKRGRLHAGAMQ